MPSIRNSIVLAVGDFAGSTGANNSFFQVRSVGRHTSTQGNIYINLKDMKATRSEQNAFLETAEGPLDLVKFFNTSRLGMGVKLVDGETRVEELSADSELSRAGLRKGDELLSIGGTKWNMLDDFQTIFRKALVQEKDLALRVRRGDRVMEIILKPQQLLK